MIKKIIDFSLHNKLAIWLMTLIVLAAGIYSATKMKMEMLPSMSTPVISITTPYPGATPEDVLEGLTEPIEKKVKNLSGVEKVTSQSLENASAVTVQYKFGTDMDEAQAELEKQIDKIDMPEGAQDKQVSQMSMYTFPIISYSISSDKADIKTLTEKIKKDLVPEIEGIEGVTNVTFSGQEVEQVELQFDDKKLKEKNLTEESVLQFIKGATMDAPLGLYTFGNDLKSIIVNGQFTNVDALKSLKIPVTSNASPQNGQSQTAQMPQDQATEEVMMEAMKNAKVPTVKLSDIAEIKTVQSRESISKTNGKDALSVQVIKSDDANTVTLANEVKEKVNAFKKEHDVDAVLMMDQAKPIEDSVKTMAEKAIIGAIFAIIMILIFLRNIRSTLIAVVSIPMSILMAMLILKQMDISLNIMTLGAMTVAIGRVIDDSIVVIENIFRRMSLKDEKLTGFELISSATREMFVPIMSSTMVTIAVFLPLALVTGSIGEIFRPFAWTVVFALLASLLIAITIVPMLAHSFFKNGIKGHHDDEEKVGKIALFYRKILDWSLKHKVIVSILSVLLLIGSLCLTPLLGTSFISTGEDKLLALTYKPKPGEKEEDVVKKGEAVQKMLSKNDNVVNTQFSVGGENPFNPIASNDMAMMVEYKKDTPNWEDEADKVLAKIAKMNHSGDWKNQDFATGGATNAVTVTVNGPSTEAIRPVVEKLEKELKDVKSLTNVSTSLSDSYDAYTLKVNHNKLSELGLTAGQVALVLNQRNDNKVVTKVGQKGEATEVILTKKKQTDWTKEKLANTKITSPLGKEVKLSDIVTIKEGKTSDTIKREDGNISATVEGKIKGKDVGMATQKVTEKVNSMKPPGNVDVHVGGTSEDIGESFSQLGLAMLAAIGIVYLILVLTFKGGLAPLAILFSLPFTLIGVILGLLAFNETLSVPSMIGMLMLIGIVVTNAIVLIDRVINKEAEGLPTREAILEAATTRVRPILMTALATVGALMPLLFGGDGSVLISKALAVTVIGGLVSSTLLTLIVVPIVYEILMGVRRKFIKQG
ncbi:efflux RND transporter permease subunit [Macrococcoides caseolyticum]|uniref:efflux RND transporter permease subunit n=1 Tax=Macrococcoides caseolyticum TaxID=69966 RepID=UPI002277D88F|nr:efflux RND transporter permease subunit [Macrococcus caseolyticus]